MRLTPEQIQIIRRTVAEIAGPKARVRLFGSRLDDQLKGGDIDLLVEMPDPVENAAVLGARLEASLELRLGGARSTWCWRCPTSPANPSTKWPNGRAFYCDGRYLA